MRVRSPQAIKDMNAHKSSITTGTACSATDVFVSDASEWNGYSHGRSRDSRRSFGTLRPVATRSDSIEG
jgi:hypothetical protein